MEFSLGSLVLVAEFLGIPASATTPEVEQTLPLKETVQIRGTTNNNKVAITGSFGGAQGIFGTQQ